MFGKEKTQNLKPSYFRYFMEILKVTSIILILKFKRYIQKWLFYSLYKKNSIF